MTSAIVNVDNFARAETDRMFAALLGDSGGVNEWKHFRTPTPLDHQPVIRQNRDTLYSANIADISQGATLTIPDRGARYLSVMIVNQDHYINQVFHDAGNYELTVDAFDTPYVLVAARTLVDPADPSDVAAVNALQDRFALRAQSARPFVLPDYDPASFDGLRAALLEVNKYVTGFGGAFGAKADVNPVHHLLGTASGWGGLPETEASYYNVVPGVPPGAYKLNVRDVPVDGFWSVSLYNAAGYFPADETGAVNVNNITAVPDADGSVTIHFGGDPGLPNRLPTMDGWNYLVRYYQPHPEILDGSWTFPAIEPA